MDIHVYFIRHFIYFIHFVGSLDGNTSVNEKEESGEDTRKCVLCQDLGDQPDKVSKMTKF